MAFARCKRFLSNIVQLQGFSRRFSLCWGKDDPCIANLNGLVLGVYSDSEDPEHPGKFTPTAERYDHVVCCRMMDLLHRYAKPPPALGEVRIFYNLERQFAAVALVGLGKECQGYDVFEKMDEGKEAIRIAAAAGRLDKSGRIRVKIGLLFRLQSTSALPLPPHLCGEFWSRRISSRRSCNGCMALSRKEVQENSNPCSSIGALRRLRLDRVANWASEGRSPKFGQTTYGHFVQLDDANLLCSERSRSAM